MSRSRTVLITGATAGIGKHIAFDLAERGYRVLASGRNRTALADLAHTAKKRGLPMEAIHLDVNVTASITSAQREVQALTQSRGIDVLINNAGYGQAGALIELDDASLRNQFETNVFGLMAVTRAFVPEMLARGSGHVINLSSGGGLVTFPMFGAYHASKYAVEALSDALRMELAPFGVHVSVLEPGPVQSEFANRTTDSLPVRDATSPYAVTYERAAKLRAFTDKREVGPEHVTRAVLRAMESARPRARYVVPPSLSVFLGVLRALPTRVRDRLLQRVFGLERRVSTVRSARRLPSSACGITGM